MPLMALLGASGAIGGSIAAALRANEIPYRAVGRDRKQLEKTFGGDSFAEIAEWNVEDPSSVRSACRGVDTLFYLVGVPYNHFELHPVLLEKTLQGAMAEGVARVLLIGTVYPYGVPRTPVVSEDHPRNPHTFKGRMRKAQEDILLKAHAENRVQGAILRLPDFYGPGVSASFLDRLFKAAAHGGTADLVGPIDTPHEYMFTPDVGPVVLRMAATPEAYGRWWNFAGPGAITQRQIADQVFAMAGRKPKLRIAGRGMLRLMGMFQPFMRELVEMHYLQTTPVLMNDEALNKLLPGIRKTPYAEGFRSTLTAYGKATANSGFH